MAKVKIVNGREVSLTAQEEAELAAELPRWEAERIAAQRARVLAEKRLEAEAALLEEKLVERAQDPDAPQPVKDWDNERRKP